MTDRVFSGTCEGECSIVVVDVFVVLFLQVPIVPKHRQTGEAYSFSMLAGENHRVGIAALD